MKDPVTATAMIVGLIACLLFSFFLIASGSGDHPESYRTWIIAGSILLGSGVIASALGQKNKQM